MLNNKIFRQLIARKPITSINNDAEANDYHRVLSALDLTCLGIGSIVGAGIFVLTGKAAHLNAGAGIVIAFMIAGFVSSLASLCYAELSSCLPVSGSAYSFTYATLGELLAWIIGWDLMLEYLVGAATVAVGWSGYFTYLVKDITGKNNVFDERFVTAPLIWLESGQTLPWNSNITVEGAGFWFNQVPCYWQDTQLCQAIINVSIFNELPAFLVVVVCVIVLVFGIKESIGFNNIMVGVKMTTILVFIIFGLNFINPQNYVPFVPANTGVRGEYGVSGVFDASNSY